MEVSRRSDAVESILFALFASRGISFTFRDVVQAREPPFLSDFSTEWKITLFLAKTKLGTRSYLSIYRTSVQPSFPTDVASRHQSSYRCFAIFVRRLSFVFPSPLTKPTALRSSYYCLRFEQQIRIGAAQIYADLIFLFPPSARFAQRLFAYFHLSFRLRALADWRWNLYATPEHSSSLKALVIHSHKRTASHGSPKRHGMHDHLRWAQRHLMLFLAFVFLLLLEFVAETLENGSRRPQDNDCCLLLVVAFFTHSLASLV